MTARKKIGQLPSAGSFSRPILGSSKLNAISRQHLLQSRNAEVDELGRIISQLFNIPEQATAIKALRTAEGLPFFTLQNKARFMDVRALVRANGFEETLAFLAKLPNADAILTQSPLLEPVRQQQQLEDEMVDRKEDETVGVYTCDKCKSGKMACRQVQTRSADEPMTIFLRCTVCSHRQRG